ncbi:VWA domain-containing protein [Candidatus Desantisbacteria bacterium]|nr:VWA domain-containing protein [Candidatus Desantisbacteria bacterium]
MIFSNPIHLLWILVLAIVAIYDCLTGGKRLFTPLFDKELSTCMLRNWESRKFYIKKGLFYSGLFFLIIAMAQPQWGKKEKILSKAGIDIALCFDVSKSMLAKDLKPNRLSNAMASLNLLIDQLVGNRLALVAFAGTSFVECPLTSDMNAIKLFLDSIKCDLIQVPGTNIGEAIDTSVQALGKSRNSKAIILITDGEDLYGKARTAAKKAKSKGIRIYPIGIGTNMGEPVPEIDGNGNEVGVKRDEKGEIVISRLDSALLNWIARKTGGKAFFVGDKGSTLPGLMTAIALLPKQGIKNSFTTTNNDQFQIFLFLSIVCFAVEFVLSTRRYCS